MIIRNRIRLHHEAQEDHKDDILLLIAVARDNAEGKIGSSTDSDDRSSRLGCCGEKVVLGEKFDHKAVKEPRLFDVSGVAGAG